MATEIVEENRESFWKKIPQKGIAIVGIGVILAYVFMTIYGKTLKDMLPILVLVAVIIYFITKSKSNIRPILTEREARDILYEAIEYRRDVTERAYHVTIPRGKLKIGMSNLKRNNTIYGSEPLEWVIGFTILPMEDNQQYFKSTVDCWADGFGLTSIQGPLDKEYLGEEIEIQRVPIADIKDLKEWKDYYNR